MYIKNCQLLKVFNDTTNTLFDIYYLIINLFIIESFNIVSAFDDYMSLQPDFIPCIEVMNAKWLDYYLNIPNIYLLRIIFYLRCKLDYLFDCLDTYYKCLDISFDVLALVRDVIKLFYSLYDENFKFYDPSFNINIE